MKKIKKISYAGRADVYNMEVEDTHDFAVNGGVIVHNCYDECRYVCMESPIAPRVQEKQRLIMDDPLDLYRDNRVTDRYDFFRI